MQRIRERNKITAIRLKKRKFDCHVVNTELTLPNFPHKIAARFGMSGFINAIVRVAGKTSNMLRKERIKPLCVRRAKASRADNIESAKGQR
jgi:hypothetical protein